ncbi:hypothetical protein HNR47_000192 [Methylopila jiangsuensis]|nr:hypothetical protein [Methylopila jiangsuensis]
MAGLIQPHAVMPELCSGVHDFGVEGGGHQIVDTRAARGHDVKPRRNRP